MDSRNDGDFAEQYYALLRRAKTAKQGEIERLKAQLDQLSLRFLAITQLTKPFCDPRELLPAWTTGAPNETGGPWKRTNKSRRDRDCV